MSRIASAALPKFPPLPSALVVEFVPLAGAWDALVVFPLASVPFKPAEAVESAELFAFTRCTGEAVLLEF